MIDFKKMKTRHDLNHITGPTISHYNERAQDFFAATKDHDVSQNREALIKAMINNHSPPFRVLDFGCGPGRDLLAFKQMGLEVTGLDGSANFCQMAREYADAPVLEQDFTALDLPAETFHGIFANASLFHVPKLCLVEVLKGLNQALLPKGVLFCSNPRGDGEGINGQRYGHYMELEHFIPYLDAAGFELVDHYYRPSGVSRAMQPWLATVSQKVSSLK